MSELLVIDLIRSWSLSHSSSHLFSVPLPSSVGTSVDYLFPLLSSVYPFISLTIRCKKIFTNNCCLVKVFDFHLTNIN